MPKKKKSEQPASLPKPSASSANSAAGNTPAVKPATKDTVPPQLSIDTLDLTKLEYRGPAQSSQAPPPTTAATYLPPRYSLLVPAPGFEEAVALASDGVANRSNIAKPPTTTTTTSSAQLHIQPQMQDNFINMFPSYVMPEFMSSQVEDHLMQGSQPDSGGLLPAGLSLPPFAGGG